jgi:DNA-binding ferritin-like protein
VINRMEKGLDDLRGEIASRLDRMAERIERLGDGGKA